EQFSPLISPDLGHCVGLTAAKSFRSRTVELGNSLDLRNRDMGIADIGKREEQRAQDGAGFGFEAKLVDDVLGGAVLVIIDVDGVKDFVVEIEIVRSVPRLLSRDNVGNEHYFAWVLPTAKSV